MGSDTADPATHASPLEDELKVNFYPPLFLQRRIWILEILRREGVTSVLDIGCGEGQLLNVLCQPAPWLLPPPSSILPPLSNPPAQPSTSPTSPKDRDEIINLHTTHIAGLDISPADLAFALENITPPPLPTQREAEVSIAGTPTTPRYHVQSLRWEPLEAKLWKGGLEVVNEDFVGVECIVSTEVIEHLPEAVLPHYAPTILGVYHPRLFLLTTPSYTFNARFTSPHSPPSARKGYPDPTGRTTRIFRHDDHKFEWTVEEFREWCDGVAREWGYEVEVGSVGRALEEDEWGRDEELGGASQVALFKRKDVGDAVEGREERARAIVEALWSSSGGEKKEHELLATKLHPAHQRAEKPGTLREIGEMVKSQMEEYREAFMRLEELWFEPEVAALCGGWIELLIRAVEDAEELVLQKEGGEGKRGTWMVELIGGVRNQNVIWPKEGDGGDAERSIDCIPMDWIPGEEGSCFGESEDDEKGWDRDGEKEEWEGSTGTEGDVSWNGSEVEDDDDEEGGGGWGSESTGGGRRGWSKGAGGWGTGGGTGGWSSPAGEGSEWGNGNVRSDAQKEMMAKDSSGTSTAGWDGDQSEDTS